MQPTIHSPLSQFMENVFMFYLEFLYFCALVIVNLGSGGMLDSIRFVLTIISTIFSPKICFRRSSYVVTTKIYWGGQ